MTKNRKIFLRLSKKKFPFLADWFPASQNSDPDDKQRENLFKVLREKVSISGGLVPAGQNSDPDDKKRRNSFLMLSKKKFLFLSDWFQPVRIKIRMTRREENLF